MTNKIFQPVLSIGQRIDLAKAGIDSFVYSWPGDMSQENETLKKLGYHLTSARYVALIRTIMGKEHCLSIWPALTSDLVAYYPKKGSFLCGVSEAPTYSNDGHLKRYLDWSEEIYHKNDGIKQEKVPIDKFAKHPVIYNMLLEQAKMYQLFLQGAKVKSFKIDIKNSKNEDIDAGLLIFGGLGNDPNDYYLNNIGIWPFPFLDTGKTLNKNWRYDQDNYKRISMIGLRRVSEPDNFFYDGGVCHHRPKNPKFGIDPPLHISASVTYEQISRTLRKLELSGLEKTLFKELGEDYE
ncbi:hypothetical protein FJZ19_04650 [Candidatus Pacearchaeota archaeon]|nr:hypothetical protein [Candidatus Pacearchaeota archaeon]